MKRELVKLIVFGIIVTFFTSVYTAFLTTVMKQGFLSDRFFINWINLIPRIYVLLLPFVLIVGPLIRALVEKMFSNRKKIKRQN
jgi:hypothetical protein